MLLQHLSSNFDLNLKKLDFDRLMENNGSLTALTHLALDVLREIFLYLNTSDIMELHGCLNLRLNFIFHAIGFSRRLHLHHPSKSHAGKLLYLLKSIPAIEEVVLTGNGGLPLSSLLELSGRQVIRHLTVSQSLVDLSYLKSSLADRVDPIPMLKSEGVVAPNISLLFPHLCSLTLHYGADSLIFEPESYKKTDKQRSATIVSSKREVISKFCHMLPASLTKLQAVCEKEIFQYATDFLLAIPATITDLCLKIYSPLGAHFLNLLSTNVKRFRITCPNQTINDMPIIERYNPNSLSLKPMLTNLVEFELGVIPKTRLHPCFTSRLFHYECMPNLDSLSLTFDFVSSALRWSTYDPVSCEKTFPPKLRTLKLYRVPPPYHSTCPTVILATLPPTLTYLLVSSGGEHWSHGHFFNMLAPLIFLQTFIEQSELESDKVEPINWDLLPQSITRMELNGFGLVTASSISIPTTFNGNSLLDDFPPLSASSSTPKVSMENLNRLAALEFDGIPPNLTYLQCPVKSLSAVHYLTKRLPNCFVKSTEMMRLEEDSWIFLNSTKLSNMSQLSDTEVFRHIYSLLGPKVHVNIHFSPHRTVLKQPLFPKEVVSLSIEQRVLRQGGVSFDPRAFHMGMTALLPKLVSLDVDTTFEIKATELPSTLTMLHLRNSPLRNPLIARCFSLPSLVRMRAHSKNIVTELPRSEKLWIVLDVPSLSVTFRRIPSFCSPKLEELCCSVYGAIDIEFKSFVEGFPSAKIQFASVSITSTGALIDTSIITHVDYLTLHRSIINTTHHLCRNLSEIIFRGLTIPNGVTSIELDNYHLPSNCVVRSELFASFPNTLTSLELRNTEFELSWDKFVPLLPNSLQHFRMSPSKSLHDLQSMIPLPNLMTLSLIWPEPLNPALFTLQPLSFDLTSLSSLTHLEFARIKIIYPLKDIFPALKHLKHIRLPIIDDIDLNSFFQDHEHIESICTDVLYITGACVPESKFINWEILINHSLSAILPRVTHGQLTLATPTMIRPKEVEEISLLHTELESLSLSQQLAEEIRNVTFMIFPSVYPSSLTKLQFSTMSTISVAWSKIIAILSNATHLQYANLDMEIDFAIEAPEFPTLPSTLKSLIMPKARCSSKKDGIVLELPETMTELYAPSLLVNPARLVSPIISLLDIANTTTVRRVQSYKTALASSSKSQQ
jgi:hypothetical protein